MHLKLYKLRFVERWISGRRESSMTEQIKCGESLAVFVDFRQQSI